MGRNSCVKSFRASLRNFACADFALRCSLNAPSPLSYNSENAGVLKSAAKACASGKSLVCPWNVRTANSDHRPISMSRRACKTSGSACTAWRTSRNGWPRRSCKSARGDGHSSVDAFPGRPKTACKPHAPSPLVSKGWTSPMSVRRHSPCNFTRLFVMSSMEHCHMVSLLRSSFILFGEMVVGRATLSTPELEEADADASSSSTDSTAGALHNSGHMSAGDVFPVRNATANVVALGNPVCVLCATGTGVCKSRTLDTCHAYRSPRPSQSLSLPSLMQWLAASARKALTLP